MENALVDRTLSRIEETPIPDAKQQLQYHLEQMRQQQEKTEEFD